jgi:hypothetical protein
MCTGENLHPNQITLVPIRKDSRMKEYLKSHLFETPAFQNLDRFIAKRKSRAVEGNGSFEEAEREIHRVLQDCERELLADEIARYDIESPYVTVEGIRYRKAHRASETYVGQAGPLRVERNLYQPVGGGRTICPVELRTGIVGGTWTPRAARIMATVVAEVPPNDAEKLIREFGGMTPSASSLDRLPKLLSESWEENRRLCEDARRREGGIPPEAASIVVSLDGVHVPLKKEEIG